MKLIIFRLFTALIFSACSVGERTAYLRKYGYGTTERSTDINGNEVCTRTIHGHVFSKCIFRNNKLIKEEQYRENGSLAGSFEYDHGGAHTQRVYYDNGQIESVAIRKGGETIVWKTWKKDGVPMHNVERR